MALLSSCPRRRLFLLPLAGGVACVALGLLLGFERSLPFGFLLLCSCLRCGGLRCGFGVARLPFGLGRIACLLGLGAGSRLRLTFRDPLLDLGIVRARLGTKLI